MSQTFFIGDTHFYHKNVIDYESRPFADTDEMNRELIKLWNSTVGKNDRVFHLGDFSFGNKEKQLSVGNQLNGYKILIMGNHDGYSIKHYMDCGFSEVYRYPIIIDDFWILSHEPKYINKNMPYANIFAHVHGNPEFTDYSSQTICVSVERKHMGYKPISFGRVKELMGVPM